MPHMRSSLGLAGTDALRRREALLVIATGEKGMTPEEWEKLVRRSAKAVAKDMAKDSDDDRFERVSAAYFHFQVDMMLWMRLRMPTEFPWADSLEVLHSCVDEPPYSTEYKQALLWREEEAIDREAPYAQKEVDELLQQQEEQVKKYKAFMASKTPSGPGSHEKALEDIDSSKAPEKSIEEIYNEAFPPPSSRRWADELEDLDEAPDPLAYSRVPAANNVESPTVCDTGKGKGKGKSVADPSPAMADPPSKSESSTEEFSFLRLLDESRQYQRLLAASTASPGAGSSSQSSRPATVQQPVSRSGPPQRRDPPAPKPAVQRPQGVQHPPQPRGLQNDPRAPIRRPQQPSLQPPAVPATRPPPMSAVPATNPPVATVQTKPAGSNQDPKPKTYGHYVPPVEQRREIWIKLFDKERPTEPGCDAFEVGIPRSWWGMVMGTHGTVISQAQKLVGCVRLAVIPLQEDKPEGDLKLIAGLQGWVNDKSPIYWKALGDVWAGINKWVLTRRLGTEKRDLAAFLESWLKDGQSGISQQISDTRKDFQEEVKKKERLRLELTARKAAAVAQVESDVAQLIVNKTDDECEQIVDAYFWNLDEPPDLCNYHEVIWEISAAWKKRVAAAGQKRAESWAWKTHRALKDG